MSTPIAAPNPLPLAEEASDNQRRFEALCRLISHAQGDFALALAEFDLPSLQDKVLDDLHARFLDLNVVTVKLTPPPPDAPRALTVLDQLEDLVKLHSSDRKEGRAPDALIITGYESLFADAVANEGQPTESLRRAIQPLNLGRNLFAEKFPCPVLLCLPPAAMGVFLRNAPDLVSWQSGYFKFESDLSARHAEFQQAAQAGTNWLARLQLRRRTDEELQAEANHLETLIADAEALLPEIEEKLIARLYHRLGWVAVALRDRRRARWAFEQMQRHARDDQRQEDQKLMTAAERGKAKAAKLKSVTLHATPQSALVQKVFRGAAALGEGEGLYGRENELRELISRATHVGTRFLTVWGETGCGKSSLVLAGLLPELKRLGHYLPVVVRQWEQPAANLRHALAQAAGLEFEGEATLLACVQRAAQQSGQTVVFICDQFEQLFANHPQRSARAPWLQAIGACVNDFRVPCKFIFILREDHLGNIAEFENEGLDPLEHRKRFYLPLFNAADAARVLRQQADEAKLEWSDAFIQTVIADLTEDGRLRPIELQLVGAALAVSGTDNELDYARAGRKQGLLVDYLQLTLDKLGQNKHEMQAMKRILLALVAERNTRLALKPEEIARHTGIKADKICRFLDQLTAAHLVTRMDKSLPAVLTTADSSVSYELTHDVLVELELILTRDLRDKQQQAARVVARALEDLTVKPHHTIGLRNWKLVRKYGDASALGNPEIKALLRRSFNLLALKSGLLLLIFITLALVLIQNTFDYVSIEQDFSDRVVVRRGLPRLSFLPFIGNDVILDTGYVANHFRRENREALQKIMHWGWSNQPSSVLAEEAFWKSLLSLAAQGELLCQTGQADRGKSLLLEALKDRDDLVRADASLALGRVAQANPALAGHMLDPLFAALKDRASDVRDAAASALGQVAQAGPEISKQMLDPLLNALWDSSDSVRRSASLSLGRVAQVNPILANQMLNPLLNVLKDNDRRVRADAALALGQAAQADPKGMLNPLLNTLKDGDNDVRRATVSALGQIAQADPTLARQVLNPLLDALEDSDNNVRRVTALALGPVAQADPTLARQVLDPLLYTLKDKDSNVRNAAASVLGYVAQADPALAHQVFNLLLNALNYRGDPYDYVRSIAASALGQAAQADPKGMLNPLLNALKDGDNDVRRATVSALGQIAQADPSLARQVLNPLLDVLKYSDPRVSDVTASALGQVAQADPALAHQVFDPLLNVLKNSDSNVRRKAASALGQVARVKIEVRNQGFRLLTDYDNDVRDGVRDSLAELLFDLAAREKKNGRNPVQFLFDHLEARQSLLPGGDANTYAIYRDVIAGAMARWLVRNESRIEPAQEALKQRLRQMCHQGKRLHLRIAAWEAFVEAGKLYEEKWQHNGN